MMNDRPAEAPMDDESPVDDVRRIRERLSAQFDNDVHKLGAYASQVAEEYRRKLGLKKADFPEPARHPVPKP